MTMIHQDNGIEPAIFAEAQTMMKKRFAEMITYYLEDVATYLVEIRAGLYAKDAKKIYPAAHTIKSSSKQLGAMQVADIAKDIEFMGRAIAEDRESGANTFEAITARTVELEAAFGKADAALKDFLEKQQAA